MVKAYLNRNEWIAVAAIAVFMLLFFKPVVSGDGFGYYVILEGAVRDQSLNLSSQLQYNEITRGSTVFLHPVTKKYVSQYAPGLPLLSAPLYAASLVLDDLQVVHLKDEFFLQERGDILVHQASTALTTTALIFIGIVATFSVLRKLKLGKFAAAAVLIAFFGSPLTRYATYDLTYTHGAEAGILALVLLAFLVWRKSFAVGLLLGLMTLVRFTSGIFVLPFLAYYFYKERRECIELLKGFLPFVLLIMLYFTVQFGGPFSTGYEQGSDLAGNFDLLPLHIPTVLLGNEVTGSPKEPRFSPTDPPGLLLWSPAVVLALAALLLWRDERKWVLLAIALLLLATSGMFFKGTTGYSFSHRYFAALFPVVAIGAAVLLKEAKKYKMLLYACAAYGLVLFLLFTASTGIINSTPPSLSEIFSYWFLEGHLTELPGELFEKLGITRFLIGK